MRPSFTFWMYLVLLALSLVASTRGIVYGAASLLSYPQPFLAAYWSVAATLEWQRVRAREASAL